MKNNNKKNDKAFAIHNVSNCADYEGFYEHLKEYEDNGIPTSVKEIIIRKKMIRHLLYTMLATVRITKGFTNI